MTALRYLGHSTYELTLSDGRTVLVDPFLTDNPDAPVAASDLSPDVILLTHGHFDHVGLIEASGDSYDTDLVQIAERTGCQVVCNFAIGIWLSQKLTAGMENVHQLGPGGGFTFDWGRCKMTPAIHGSILPDGSDGGQAGGFLLTLDDGIVYIAGDTALFSDMQLIGHLQDDQQIDLAILPIGDNFTMGPHDAFLAAGYLDAKVVTPCHYNTFGLIEQDAEAWAEWVKKETDSGAVVLKPGETYELGQG